ncbi:phosphoribosylglycinamide formyltransferase, chloroplastic-like [Zingiber officinale]|uniref:phosphoribosylglycinamide formyltransferase, chloroplastic-like n=1 Tax=Zingiber officinale TaxID=94328 RepID=UPI001C4C7CB9|nr:phosphoribosylglycinamide formyltransferase, chloroplastic-like [Zingiber officinale]XP_042385047.1 phosphoribosylglycinamide formyltransferase, chloroplastic-like [Zingiber officinale]
MEALASSIRIILSSPPGFMESSPKCLVLRSASRDASSSCLGLKQRQTLKKTSSFNGVLQKADRKNLGFECRCDASETENYVEMKKTSGSSARRKRLAVFVSGGGSNFRSIHEAIKGKLVHGDISVLVTDKPGCGGAEYARDNQIPVVVYPHLKSSSDGVSTSDLIAILRKCEVDFILLAGFLKLIPVELVREYPKSIVNIHPSLLPAFGGKGFYGLKVHKAVIESGARYSGPTIHFVDENYDTGRTLAQRVVPVLADDSVEDLAARVLEQEHKLYVEVVSALCDDRIVWREDGVPLIRSKENPEKLY